MTKGLVTGGPINILFLFCVSMCSLCPSHFPTINACTSSGARNPRV